MLLLPIIMIAAMAINTIIVALFSLNPISETLNCTFHNCTIAQNTIFGPIEERQTLYIKNKDLLYVERSSSIIPQYYIKYYTDFEKSVNLFSTGYLSRRNAERDAAIIKVYDNSHIIKRNVLFINIFCISLYILFLIIGVFVKRIIRARNNNQILIKNSFLRQNDTREN